MIVPNRKAIHNKCLIFNVLFNTGDIQVIELATSQPRLTLTKTTLTVTIKHLPCGYGFTIRGCEPISVSRVKPSSSAEVAGLMASDTILAVNGHDVTQLTASCVASLIREASKTGSSGITELVLKVSRPQYNNQIKEANVMNKNEYTQPLSGSRIEDMSKQRTRQINNTFSVCASKENIPPIVVSTKEGHNHYYQGIDRKRNRIEINNSRGSQENDTGYETLSQYISTTSEHKTNMEETSNSSYSKLTYPNADYKTSPCLKRTPASEEKVISKWSPSDISIIYQKSFEEDKYSLSSSGLFNMALCARQLCRKEAKDSTRMNLYARLSKDDLNDTADQDEGRESFFRSDTDKNNKNDSPSTGTSLDYQNNQSSHNEQSYQSFDEYESYCINNNGFLACGDVSDLVNSVNTFTELSCADEMVGGEDRECEPRRGELAQLEQEYVTVMTRGVNLFTRPLRFSRILSASQHRTLFQNVEKVS